MTIVFELAGRRVEALDHLDQALARGYSLKSIEKDPELLGLRRDARYQVLIQKYADTRSQH
jgi:hypothetical protein